MPYSEALMHYRIGDQVISFWGWQSAMFLVSILSVAVSFGGAGLLADRRTAIALNRLTHWDVSVQILLSIALVGLLDQWSFVLGQLILAVLFFPFKLELIRRSLAMDHSLPLQFAVIGGHQSCGAGAAPAGSDAAPPALDRNGDRIQRALHGHHALAAAGARRASIFT